MDLSDTSLIPLPYRSLVIRAMDLSDTDNYLASEGVVEAAVEAGFYSPASGRPFDFLAAFSYFNARSMHLGDKCPPDYNLYSGRRTWRVFDKLAPSLNLDPTLGQIAYKKTYPVSVKVIHRSTTRIYEYQSTTVLLLASAPPWCVTWYMCAMDVR
jgi:dipeptidase